MSKESRFVVGRHRGPFLTPGDPEDQAQLNLTKTESAGGLSLTRTPTGKQKLMRHWKRFWFFYCIGNIVFLAIFLPIFFLLIIPAIAQLVVNKSDLVLTKAVLTLPNPDSVMLTLETKVDLHLAIPARVENIPLYLYQKDYGTGSPYASVTVDGQIIKGNHTLGVYDAHTPILNETTWEEFVHQIVFQEETSLAVTGQTNAYLGVLKSHVHLNKEVPTRSLNKFEGFYIADAGLVFNKSDGHNFEGNLSLPNPTLLSFEVGDFFLNIQAGDLLLGNATLKNVSLAQGTNVFPIQGTLDIKTLIKHLGGVLKTEASALKGGNLSLNAITQTVHWNDQLIPWYSNVLQKLNLNAEIPLKDLIKYTLSNLKSQTNFSDILHSKNLTGLGGLTDSSSGSESNPLAERDSDGPVSIASLMRRSKYIQEAFEDVHPVEREFIIDSFAGHYL